MKDLYDFLKSFDMHTIIIVGIAFWILNSSMNEQFKEIRSDITELMSDIKVIKTVLIMKEILPASVATQKKDFGFVPFD